MNRLASFSKISSSKPKYFSNSFQCEHGGKLQKREISSRLWEITAQREATRCKLRWSSSLQLQSSSSLQGHFAKCTIVQRTFRTSSRLLAEQESQSAATNQSTTSQTSDSTDATPPTTETTATTTTTSTSTLPDSAPSTASTTTGGSSLLSLARSLPTSQGVVINATEPMAEPAAIVPTTDLVHPTDVNQARKPIPGRMVFLGKVPPDYTRPVTSELYFDEGAVAHASGYPEKAIGLFKKALELDPKEWQVLNNMGNAYMDLGQHNLAIRHFEKSIQYRPTYKWSYYNKATALLKMKKYPEAIAAFDEALTIDPQFAEAFTNKGNALVSLGRFEEAVACYNEAIKANPLCMQARSDKGRALHLLGKYDDAVVSFMESISEYSARIASLEGQIATYKAERAVERYYKLEDDDNFDIREYNFIETDEMKAYTRPEEEKQKEDDDKLKLFQKRLRMKAEEKENEKNQKDLERLRTQLTRVYNNTGNALIALRRYDDALRHFQRALELHPTDEIANYNKGVALFCMRRFDEAIETFTAIVASTSSFAKASALSIGECYNAMRKFDEALALFESILQREPENVVAVQGKQFAMNPPPPLPPPPPPVETPPPTDQNVATPTDQVGSPPSDATQQGESTPTQSQENVSNEIAQAAPATETSAQTTTDALPSTAPITEQTNQTSTVSEQPLQTQPTEPVTPTASVSETVVQPTQEVNQSAHAENDSSTPQQPPSSDSVATVQQ